MRITLKAARVNAGLSQKEVAKNLACVVRPLLSGRGTRAG